MYDTVQHIVILRLSVKCFYTFNGIHVTMNLLLYCTINLYITYWQHQQYVAKINFALLMIDCIASTFYKKTKIKKISDTILPALS